MRRFPGGRVRSVAFAAVVLGLVAGGVAYATIPGNDGTISGCYDKNNGNLRVVDHQAGKTCRNTEKTLDWNQAGPRGERGPAGTAGPTSLTSGFALVPVDPGVTLTSHTVTAAEAGLTIVTAEMYVFDKDGFTGGVTAMTCGVRNSGGGAQSRLLTVSDNDDVDEDSTSTTFLMRVDLNEGDVVSLACKTVADDADQAFASGSLLLERVDS